MRTLYLDCGMGAAGDMLTAALLELLPEPDAFVGRLNALALPGVQFERKHDVKCGITGTRMSVTVHGVEEGAEDHEHSHGHHDSHNHGEDHEHSHGHSHSHDHSHSHHHSGMKDIENIVSGMALPASVHEDVLAVYKLVAEAESKVHGVPVTDIHFHEVGAMDAIADITAVCLLMHELSPDEVIVSPIHVGSGQVKCAHGILPVPAPATACILKDIPIYGGAVRGELCTPTGAALLRHFADRFGDMPMMRMQKLGYGMGKKDFDTANCVRAILGEREAAYEETKGKTDVVLELSCNVDDMTAEEIGFASERFFEDGALDVYTVPIGMKKSRPGTLLRVICRESGRDRMLDLFFRHTTTLGVRETTMRRYVLERSEELVQTPYGEVRCKVSSGYGVRRVKYEYDDLSRIARERGMTLDDVRRGLS